MRSLIYAMMRSGGTECTPTEVKNSIPLYDLPDIFKVVFNIFNNQNFQHSDMEKLKQEKSKNILTKNEESQSELDWDFYFMLVIRCLV